MSAATLTPYVTSQAPPQSQLWFTDASLVTFPSAINDTLKHNRSGSDDVAIDEVSKSPTIFVYKGTTSEMNLALTQD